MKKITLCSLLLIFSACIKKTPEVQKNPEELVKFFVGVSAGAKEDEARTQLKDLCQGELRRAFENMTADAFRIAYLSNTLKLKEVKILESKTEKDRARLVYEVAVENPGGTDPTAEVVQREVELVQMSGAWYLDSIRPKGSDKIAFTKGMIF